MFDIIAARTKDTNAIEALLDGAFGANRHDKRSYHYRDGVNDVPALRFVAISTGQLCGTIRFWPVTIGGNTEALLLGPLGVAPGHQSLGIGAELMTHGMNAARIQGYGIVILVGELEYYGRFGFASAPSRGIHMPGEQDHRLLVRELHNDALDGVAGDVTSLAEKSVFAA